VLALLSNDDGIYAPGLEALVSQVSAIARVVVVAPEVEQSAVGHAISIYNPLRVTEIYKSNTLYGYAVRGTPADCVKLAVAEILDRPPDIVISGINLGKNVGDCILYSGTVSAATEGAILGIPSMAVSLATYSNPDFSYAARFAARMAELIGRRGLPHGTLLNVNVPALRPEQISGVCISRQGRFIFKDIFRKLHDPYGRDYFWLETEDIQQDANSDNDLSALKQGKISITPLKYDLTDHGLMKELKEWDITL